jgi:hypothetical protein
VHHDVPAENSLMLEVLDIACLTLNLHVNVFAQVFLGVRAIALVGIHSPTHIPSLAYLFVRCTRPSPEDTPTARHVARRLLTDI